MIVLLPLAMMELAAFVITREERHLLSKFAGEFDTYTRRVRRWL
jgi:protein-S-isoprenylcysteine O-methyltransferase Ste14